MKAMPQVRPKTNAEVKVSVIVKLIAGILIPLTLVLLIAGALITGNVKKTITQLDDSYLSAETHRAA